MYVNAAAQRQKRTKSLSKWSVSIVPQGARELMIEGVDLPDEEDRNGSKSPACGDIYEGYGGEEGKGGGGVDEGLNWS